MQKLDLSLTNQTDTNLIVGLSGVGHQPTLEQHGWIQDVPALVFSGSTNYLAKAEQYLVDESTQVYDSLFSCDSVSWKEWSVFVVCQLTSVPAVEASIWGCFGQLPAIFPGTGNPADTEPKIVLVASATDFKCAIWNDGCSTWDVAMLGSTDTNAHLFEISADGVGNINVWLDGTLTTIADQRPKTVGMMQIGAGVYGQPRYQLQQLNGTVARMMLFDTDLPSAERTKYRNILRAQYGV